MTRLTEKKPPRPYSRSTIHGHSSKIQKYERKVVTKNKYSRSVQAAAIVISSQGSRRMYFLTEKKSHYPLPEAVVLLLDR
jgi:hypothetical protein